MVFEMSPTFRLYHHLSVCAGDTGEPFRSHSAAERVQELMSKFVVELYRGRWNFWKRGEASRLMQRVRTSEGLCTSQLFGGVMYTSHKRPYAHGYCRKMILAN
jgi:hypothetical protein